jgi:hypothetical protein
MPGALRRWRIFCLVVCTLQPVFPAVAGDCSQYVAAIVKSKHTPYRQESTITEITGPAQFELATKIVFAGDALYELRNGAWKKTAADGDMLEQRFRSGRRAFSDSCDAEGTESLNGEPANIVVLQSESATAIKDSSISESTRYWISQKSGLPLRSEHVVSISHPDREMAIVKYTDTLSYDGVAAPAD